MQRTGHHEHITLPLVTLDVDDYLSEQMAQMSENLKSWLRAEVTQHLTEQDKTLTKDYKQKD